MLRLEGKQEVPRFKPRAVFDAGSMVSSLPQLKEMRLTSQEDEESLQIDSQLAVDLFVPAQIPMVPESIRIDMKVSDFSRGECVILEGESSIADATLSLALTSLKGRGAGTLVEHALSIKCHGRVRGKLVETALGLYLPSKIEEFSQEHVARTLAELKGEVYYPSSGIVNELPKRAAA